MMYIIMIFVIRVGDMRYGFSQISKDAGDILKIAGSCMISLKPAKIDFSPV